MQRANPEALMEDVLPVLQARVSRRKLDLLLPVEMDDLDPLSEPEPSIGALIELDSRDLLVATYGLETGELLLQVPESKPLASALKAILEEVPLDAEDIIWRADTTEEADGSLDDIVHDGLREGDARNSIGMGVATKAMEVFFSYAHEDEVLMKKLETHLANLRRQKIITAWHDLQIGAGQDWRGQIETHLQTAQIILLFISPAFMASDFCNDVELARAMARHNAGEARVIPVILRPVDWQDALFSSLQALPKDAKPVTTWPDQDEAMLDIVQGIRAAVEALRPQAATWNSPQAAIWNVPHAQNPNFSGREDLLAQLRAELQSGQNAALIQAISGLGGVGKTQVALEYAYRHAADYALIWWLHAEEPATLARDYAALADPLQLSEQTASDQQETVNAVRRWLGQHPGWLLIFDNASTPAVVRPYLPPNQTGQVLITSRNPTWRSIAHVIPLHPWEPDEAVHFLRTRTGRDEVVASQALTAVLGHLPLALEQAGAYIEATGTTVAAYLALFQTRRADLWATEHPPEAYPETVATTWTLAMEALQSEAPTSADLLNLCAYLGPEDIPRTLVCEGVAALPPALAATVQDVVALDRVVRALRQYSTGDAGRDLVCPSLGASRGPGSPNDGRSKGLGRDRRQTHGADLFVRSACPSDLGDQCPPPLACADRDTARARVTGRARKHGRRVE